LREARRPLTGRELLLSFSGDAAAIVTRRTVGFGSMLGLPLSFSPPPWEWGRSAPGRALVLRLPLLSAAWQTRSSIAVPSLAPAPATGDSSACCSLLMIFSVGDGGTRLSMSVAS
jgi:hypothetical protein